MCFLDFLQIEAGGRFPQAPLVARPVGRTQGIFRERAQADDEVGFTRTRQQIHRAHAQGGALAAEGGEQQVAGGRPPREHGIEHKVLLFRVERAEIPDQGVEGPAPDRREGGQRALADGHGAVGTVAFGQRVGGPGPADVSQGPGGVEADGLGGVLQKREQQGTRVVGGQGCEGADGGDAHARLRVGAGGVGQGGQRVFVRGFRKRARGGLAGGRIALAQGPDRFRYRRACGHGRRRGLAAAGGGEQGQQSRAPNRFRCARHGNCAGGDCSCRRVAGCPPGPSGASSARGGPHRGAPAYRDRPARRGKALG
jgi:hypothetical protein